MSNFIVYTILVYSSTIIIAFLSVLILLLHYYGEKSALGHIYLNIINSVVFFESYKSDIISHFKFIKLFVLSCASYFINVNGIFVKLVGLFDIYILETK